ncbi:MAG TPA: phage portal protein, partial [Candidatus Paceibacterota bacterium]
ILRSNMSSDNSGLIADALLKSNPALALSMDASNAFKAEVLEHGARVALYRDYERGDHRASVTDQMKKMLRIKDDDSGMVDFNGNYCGIVVDKMAGRLHVSEITTKDTSVDDDWLAPLLEENDWDNLQTTTFRGAIRDADSYIMVDPQTLTWTAEPAYDGFSGIVAIFETGARTPMWACKIWSESEDDANTNTMRLVVYQPGSVSYWRGQEGGAEVEADSRVTVESEGEIVQQNNARFPLSKVPIVHFANRYENYSEEGESEIRAAVPLQDVYNRTLHSMVMASEFAAFRVAWSIGLEMNVDGYVPGAVINLLLKDASGNVINEPTDAMLAFMQAVRVGQFEATDLSQYINELDKIVREISQVTQTPIYGVTADGNLSGEALKQLEIGLIGKVIRFQQQNTDAVRELIELTAEIQNAFRIEGLGNAPEIDQVAVTWKSPEILDVTSQIQALTQMRTSAPGLWSDDWYRSKIGGLLGMSQNDITKQAEEVKTQKREQLRTKINTARVPVEVPAEANNQ